MKRLTRISLISMLAIAGCGGDSGSGSSCTAVTMGAEAKSVANSLLVPMQKSDYAMDLTGNGKLDNQLGNIIGALTAQNLNTQDGVNMAITGGNVVLLLDQTADSLTSSSCSSVTVSVGNKATTPPKFDGTDTFTINTTVGGGNFKGGVTGGVYNSNSPVTATAATEVVMTLQLPLVAGSDPVQLKIHGAHVQFTRAGDNLTKGQINGAIKSQDVQTSIIPSVATLLTNKVMAGTGMMSTNQQILDIFDTGGNDDPMNPSGCKNADGTPACKSMAGPDTGTCALKGDKKISTCEVATNSIIKNVLAPDVQMFSADGSTYMPNPDNTHKDSLSLGLAFTAVKATF